MPSLPSLQYLGARLEIVSNERMSAVLSVSGEVIQLFLEGLDNQIREFPEISTIFKKLLARTSAPFA